jgi:methylmalonyl-CoA carboxyltransferase large subunit
VSTETPVDVAALQRLVAELSQRVELLEADLASRQAQAARPSEEVMMVISAAVAAFLGKKAILRQVHLTHTTAWAQQGRASIFASHHDPHRPR